MSAKYQYLIVSLFLSLSLIGQNDDFIINTEHYTQEDGLSNNNAVAVIQDSRGVVWIGTNNGLNRFDGQNFKKYTTQNGLEQNNINNLYQDGDILWCIHRSEETGNQNKEFTLFDTQKEEVIPWVTYKKDLPFEKKDIIRFEVFQHTNTFLMQFKDQSYYYFINGKGLIKLSQINKEEYFIPLQDGVLIWNGHQSEQNYIRKIDTNGKEVYKTEVDIPEIETNYGFTLLGTTDKNELLLLCLVTDDYTCLMKVTENGVITRNETYKEAFRSLDIPPLIVLQQEFKFYYLSKYDAFAYIYNNLFLLFTFDGKVIYMDEKPIYNDIDNILYAEHHSEIIWATGAGQLHQINLKKNNFINHQVQSAKGFRGISQIQDYLYFSHTNGILQLSLDTKNLTEISSRGALSNVKDRTNHLIASAYGTLRKLDLSTNTQVTEQIQGAAELWAMYPDDNNRIWYSEQGIFNFDFETKKVQEGKYNGFEELKENTIYYFYEKKDGNLWLCTTSGLYEWHPKKGVLARYWKGGKGPFHIPTDDVRHFYFDEKDESYWLATRQDGLIHWQPKTQTSKVFTLNRLQSNILHSVFADDFGYLWLSTEHGIIQFDKASASYQVHLPKDGTLSSEYNRISHFQDENGIIYFGSNTGITEIHPERFKDSKNLKNTSKVIVVELSQYLDKTNQIENLTSNFYTKNRIELQPGDRFFSLTLTVDDYGENKKAHYLYKIKGDKEWATAKTNEVSISGLPYGRQTLVIQASLENGSYSDILNIPIWVKRPFYLTWWFLLLLLAFIVSSTYIIIQIRTKRLQTQKIALAEEVQKRTQTIAAQTEELKALDKVKMRFFANVSHELRTPITLIKGPINTILKNNTFDQRNTQLLTTAQQNTNNLLALVNEILDLTKLETNKLSLDEKPIGLYLFIQKIISNFQFAAHQQGLTLTLFYQLDKETELQLDTNKIEKIINNLLSNALKFTAKGGAINLIVADMESNTILFQVKDTGRGIPSEDLPYIFDRYYQSVSNQNSDSYREEGGLGIGLALSMEFAKLMNGNIWVESETNQPKQGTTFFFQMPKRLSHSLKAVNLPIEADETAMLPIIAIEDLQETVISNTDREGLPTVLLVEDHHELRAYIKMLLTPHHQVITAKNGAEALEWLNTQQASDNPSFPSLIISDVMMPIMDGFELLQQVKSNPKWRSIPFIILTARAEMANKLKALRIGVDDYMVKPFDEEELLLRVENLLQNFEERQVLATTNPTTDTQTATPNISEKDEQWLRDIEQLTLETVTTPQFSVDFLANELNINRSKLYRKIKQLTGLTPNKYIKIIRLKIAKDLLENREVESVKEVAHHIGFVRIDYFSKIYKQEFGKMPSEYLK